MKIKYLFVIIFATAAITACTKEIEFKGDQSDPKLVINCIAEKDKPVKAYFGKSIFFLDSNENKTPPDDFVSMLYVNGNPMGQVTPQVDTVWNEYIYNENGEPILTYNLVTSWVNDYRPVEGDIIKITASANGFDDVEGTSSPIPNRVDWRLVKCDTILIDTSTYEGVYSDNVTYTNTEIYMTIEINDPNPGQTNYFRINEVSRRQQNDNEENSYTIILDYEDDPIFADMTSELNLYSNLGVFTDKLFDGGSYMLKVKLSSYINNTEDYDPDFFYATIYLEHISKEYYYYLNTYYQDNGLLQLVAEPMQTYTNVNNGYGLVGAQTSDSLMLPLLPVR